MYSYDNAFAKMYFFFTQISYEHIVNNLWKILVAEPCPSCGILVQKNGGCQHMRCARCLYEFCWTCLGQYKKYSHDQGMAKYCGQSFLVYSSLYSVSLLIFIIKLSAFPGIPFDSFPTNPFKYMAAHATAFDTITFLLAFTVTKGIMGGSIFFYDSFFYLRGRSRNN